MTADELADTLDRSPFVPVRISLNDGEQIVLAARGRAVLTTDTLVAAVSADPFAPPEGRRFRMLPSAKIRAVEDFDARTLRRG